MWYRKHLRQVQRARRLAKTQQQALLALELEGFIALTLHTATHILTIAVEREVGAQIADSVREALRERRRSLKREADQLRRDGGENEYRRGIAQAEAAPQISTGQSTVPLPTLPVAASSPE